MLKEFEAASRVICERLRQRPYQKGVTITAWNAVIDQFPDADIDTITDCLYPHIFQATLPRIHRAVRNRERKEGEPMD
jgi:hypothetical protein